MPYDEVCYQRLEEKLDVDEMTHEKILHLIDKFLEVMDKKYGLIDDDLLG